MNEQNSYYGLYYHRHFNSITNVLKHIHFTDMQTKFVCEGTNLKVECPGNEVIRISSAVYGTPVSG